MKRTIRISLLLSLVLVIAGFTGSLSVMASSGIQSPAEGTKVYGLKVVNIQHLTGYESNREDFCEIFVKNANGELVHSSNFEYSTTRTSIKISFLPSEYGKYRIYANEYWLGSYGIKNYGRKYGPVTINVVKPGTFSSVKGQFTLSTNHGGKATIGFRTPGATGHVIYRSTSKTGTFKKIATTTKKSFTNSGLGFKTYYYKVKPYVKSGGKTYYGKAVQAGINCKAVTKLYRLVNSKGKNIKGINVFCNATGVNGYKVYKATKKNGTFKCISTSRDPGYTDKNVTNGKIYYYKVRPYIKSNGKIKYLGYTAVKSIRAQW